MCNGESVDVDFARQLKKELNGFCLELGREQGEVALAMVNLQVMKRELAEAQRQLAIMSRAYTIDPSNVPASEVMLAKQSEEIMRRELAEAKQNLDRTDRELVETRKDKNTLTEHLNSLRTSCDPFNGNAPQYCGTCHAPMTAVRPGKAQCEFCEERERLAVSSLRQMTHAQEMLAEKCRQVSILQSELSRANADGENLHAKMREMELERNEWRDDRQAKNAKLYEENKVLKAEVERLRGEVTRLDQGGFRQRCELAADRDRWRECAEKLQAALGRLWPANVEAQLAKGDAIAAYEQLKGKP
jgi:chromosome segregation ATPase